MEQRSSFRVQFEEKVRYGYLNRPFYDGTLLNISENGLAVKVDSPLPENTVVSIIIYHLGNPVELEGEVKRVSQCYYSNEYELGIRITARNPQYISIYDSMLKRII